MKIKLSALMIAAGLTAAASPVFAAGIGSEFDEKGIAEFKKLLGEA